VVVWYYFLSNAVWQATVRRRPESRQNVRPSKWVRSCIRSGCVGGRGPGGGSARVFPLSFLFTSSLRSLCCVFRLLFRLSQQTIIKATSIEFPVKPAVSDEAKEFIRLCLTHSHRDRPDVLEVCHRSQFLKFTAAVKKP
jgi:hypothetical protein